MSISSYKDLLLKDEEDINSIVQYPTIIDYKNATKSEQRIPSLFVAVDIINNQNFTKSIIFVVKKLVPNFKETHPNEFSFRHFTEGITNKLVCITDTNTGFSVIVRTFGSYTEYVIDRKSELMVIKSCSNITLYGTFLNGVVYSYIPGRTLSLGDLIDLKTFKNTAIAIAEHHKIEPPMIKVPMLFVTLRRWLKNVPFEYVDSNKKPYDINVLKKELIFMENLLNKNEDIVLCHNDLLLKNFIKEKNGKVSLIDFEYSTYNYRAFDLANHFCEWCGFECHWDSYPNEETQRRFISLYLSAYYGEEIDVDNEKVNKLIEDIKLFEMAPNFFWGVWALIQGALSTIDFNYISYAHKRLERYFEVKKYLLEGKSSRKGSSA